MQDKNGLELGTAQRGRPGKTILVKNTTASDMATIRDTFGYRTDPIDGSTLIFSDLDAAINAVGANSRTNKGDVILISEGYTEEIAAAADISQDTDGISIIGLGEGADRPTFTFSATASTWVMSGANSVLKNVIFVPSINAVVSPLVISGADCTVDIEIRDASSTVECERGVLTTVDADNLDLKLKYVGFTAGDACVNAVRLVGGSQTRIDIDFYGKASVAVVEFLTTAVVDCIVTGHMYNSGTTDFSKSVVDTATGSTWSADFFDGAAGAGVSGGSGNALAAGDLSTMATAITAIQADVGDPSARTNLQDLEAMIGVPDTADSSLYDILIGTTAGVADPILGKKVTRSAADILNGGTVALFTVAGGKVLITALVMENGVGATDAASNVKFVMNPSVGTDADMNAATAVGASEIGSLWNCPLNGSNSLSIGKGGGGLLKVDAGWVAAEGTIDINSTADANVTNSATQTIELWYKPLDVGATVVTV